VILLSRSHERNRRMQWSCLQTFSFSKCSCLMPCLPVERVPIRTGRGPRRRQLLQPCVSEASTFPYSSSPCSPGPLSHPNFRDLYTPKHGSCTGAALHDFLDALFSAAFVLYSIFAIYPLTISRSPRCRPIRPTRPRPGPLGGSGLYACWP